MNRRRFLGGVKSGGGAFVLPDKLNPEELGQDGVDLFNYFFEKCGGDSGGEYVLPEPWIVTVYFIYGNGYSQAVTITSVTSHFEHDRFYLSFENPNYWGIWLYEDGELQTTYD